MAAGNSDMNFLDCFVREQNSDAPLKFLNGFTFFVICNLIMFSGPFVLMNNYGFVGFLMFIPLLACVVPLDIQQPRV